MRRFDKKQHIKKANILLEERRKLLKEYGYDEYENPEMMGQEDFYNQINQNSQEEIPSKPNEPKILRFDRHKQMSPATRDSVLKLIRGVGDIAEKDENLYFLDNYLYGLFDGYFYVDYLNEGLQTLSQLGYEDLANKLNFIISEVSKYQFDNLPDETDSPHSYTDDMENLTSNDDAYGKAFDTMESKEYKKLNQLKESFDKVNKKCYGK